MRFTLFKMIRSICWFQIILNLWTSLCYATNGYQEASVYLSGGKISMRVGLMDKSATAYGFYNNTLLTTGWGVLEVKGREGGQGVTDEMRMYAAGFLEGALTAEQMWLHYTNLRPVFLKSTANSSLEEKYRTFFKQQDAWTRSMITGQGPQDPFWRHVGYVTAHLDGLYAGYKSFAKPEWEQSEFIVQFLNAVGDMLDIRHMFDKSSRPNFDQMSHSELLNYVQTHGHCSALVKVLPAYENLYMSHSTWFSYQSTMRIYKHYHFNLEDEATNAKSMSFSSYPGILVSVDDFYLLSSNMVLLQTTNNVFNTSLYDLLGTKSLLAWQRVSVANMIADNGRKWYEIFKQFNSGTYNNQYMIIDLKRVSLNSALGDGTLWVVEQIPGLVVGDDQTSVLRTGYWPSYNVPFYETIYDRSGYPDIVKQKGTDFSYELAPRAKIFRRDQGKVKDMNTMKHIMRYNDYEDDKYSEGNACNTICCRGDLSPRQIPNGCYDTKVSDMSMALNFQAHIINGPTLGDGLQPFSWTGPFFDYPHKGLPLMYNFDWQTTKPRL